MYVIYLEGFDYGLSLGAYKKKKSQFERIHWGVILIVETSRLTYDDSLWSGIISLSLSTRYNIPIYICELIWTLNSLVIFGKHRKRIILERLVFDLGSSNMEEL